MKYGLKIFNFNGDYSVGYEEETDDLEQARSTAVSISNWNVPCQLIDLESGEILQHFPAYKDRFLE